MERKKYSVDEIIDWILAIGGSAAGSVMTLVILGSGGAAFEAVLLTVGAWAVAAWGGFRWQKRYYEALLTPSQGQKAALPNAQTAQSSDLEVRLLDALALKKGQFTLVEAVVLLREPVDWVLPMLERLQQHGIGGSDVSNTGELLYTTSGFNLAKSGDPIGQ